jgi:hypothetical protein
MKRLRVIVFGTGFVGHFALRAVIENPRFELVGAWVHYADKVGTDAGDFAGTGKTGILATHDVDALLALGADCAIFCSAGNGNEDWTIETQARFLAAGTNVVSSSMSGMNHPRSYRRQDLVKRIAEAAAAGGASFLSSGMDPGYSSDLAINMTQMSRYWTQIRIQEIYDYSTYVPTEAETVLKYGMGFGMAMDFQAHLFQPGVMTEIWGGPSLTLIADALEVKLEDIREVYEREASDVSFEVPKLGMIAEGTQEAVRFEVQGIVDGRVAIVAEHITRLRKGSAGHWPQGDLGEGYYVQIHGDPLIRGHASFTGPGGEHQYGAILGTAMKLVNSVAPVCAAKPGVLVAPMDLPAMMGKGIYRPA